MTKREHSELAVLLKLERLTDSALNVKGPREGFSAQDRRKKKSLIRTCVTREVKERGRKSLTKAWDFAFCTRWLAGKKGAKERRR